MQKAGNTIEEGGSSLLVKKGRSHRTASPFGTPRVLVLDTGGSGHEKMMTVKTALSHDRYSKVGVCDPSLINHPGSDFERVISLVSMCHLLVIEVSFPNKNTFRVIECAHRKNVPVFAVIKKSNSSLVKWKKAYVGSVLLDPEVDMEVVVWRGFLPLCQKIKRFLGSRARDGKLFLV